MSPSQIETRFQGLGMKLLLRVDFADTRINKNPHYESEFRLVAPTALLRASRTTGINETPIHFRNIHRSIDRALPERIK